MPDPKLILDHVYDHEAAQPGRVFLTQPIGGGAVVDYTWGRSRRPGAPHGGAPAEPGLRARRAHRDC